MSINYLVFFTFYNVLRNYWLNLITPALFKYIYINIYNTNFYMHISIVINKNINSCIFIFA